MYYMLSGMYYMLLSSDEDDEDHGDHRVECGGFEG
jgi:hypothetical protein